MSSDSIAMSIFPFEKYKCKKWKILQFLRSAILKIHFFHMILPKKNKVLLKIYIAHKRHLHVILSAIPFSVITRLPADDLVMVIYFLLKSLLESRPFTFEDRVKLIRF